MCNYEYMESYLFPMAHALMERLISHKKLLKLSKRMVQATSVNLMKPQTPLYNLKSRIIWFLYIYTKFFIT